MKRILTCLLVFLGFVALSQQPFIKKINDANYGYALKVLPTNDLGWVVFSLDGLKLTKFNSCGNMVWSKKYTILNTTYHADIKTTPSGGFVLLGSATTGAAITSIDTTGNVVWSKVFELNNYSQYLYTIDVDAAGNLVYDSNVSDDTGTGNINNMLCKLDPAGNVIWAKIYNHGGIWGGSILTSDNGILMRTGDTFIKTDNNGAVLWTSKCLTGFYNYFAPIEVSDGYIFTKYDPSAATKNICFYKLDLQGNLVWGGGKLSNYEGVPPTLKRKQNGNIFGIFNYNNYPTIVEFDKDLNVIAENSFSSNLPVINLMGKDACFTTDQFPIIVGSATDGLTMPFVIKTSKKYAIDCEINPVSISFNPSPITQSFDNTFANSIIITSGNNTASSVDFINTTIDICAIANTLIIGHDTTICEGESLLLKNNSGNDFDNYLWSTGQTTPGINVHLQGIYWLKASNHCDNIWQTDTFKLTVKPAVVARLGADIVKCENTTLLLSAPNASTCKYSWSNGSTNHSIEVVEDGIYWLTIENDNGCKSTDTIQVNHIKCECSVYLPNSFTPNGDGLNDVFKPVYHCDFKEYSLQIFNRWGELLFETNDPEAIWNGYYHGQLVKEDIYNYIVNYTPDIKNSINSRSSKKGIVAVIY